MEYSTFLKLIMTNKKIGENMHDLYQVGVDIFESKYAVAEHISSMFNASLESHYNKEGIDWVSWFMYENEYGQADWSKNPSYKIDDNGNMVLEKEAGEVRYGAYDEEGNPIAFSYESLYELLEKDYKL
jgi:hypothetical protein